jgi:Cu/Zn superoxide dismutase
MRNATSAGGHYVGSGSSSHGCPENGTTRHEGDLVTNQNFISCFDIVFEGE